ncbi:7-cyano-7-deazaguanine synthase QueC [Sulfurimonas sp. SAG-AH-194-C21]|nr:7-cyano-7-deazaguanine synthase QueC [Sulfurimonas sp. SAG-AH-194-C21]MDF1883789.1 7-cyano-7-deazaguanine synthase QueC [Sulfurimonas sp. SAG-AH-194-C21]
MNNKRLIKKAVCIMSGGMDSTLSAQMMKNDGFEVIAVHFNYGQRTQTKEQECFDSICKHMNISKHYSLDLDFFKHLGASALTDTSLDIPVSGVEEGVPITYVPFRNGIFLSMAAAIAEKEGAELISIGVVQEDSSGYPDCRETYIKAMQNAINLGTKDETNIKIHMPLVHLLKSEIVTKSLELQSPLSLTWSCYKNEDKACGVCDSCRLRLNGFLKAGVVDPITYE